MAMTEEVKAEEIVSDGLQILICGGGNGGHVFAALCSAQKKNKVHWLSLYADESARIKAKLAEGDLCVEYAMTDPLEVVRSRPTVVTKSIEEAAIGSSDIILLCVPAFAHNQYLDAICSADLKKGCIIAVFPSGGGFELQYLAKMREKGKNAGDYMLLNCLTLPWACRIKAPLAENYGGCVVVLDTKDMVEMIAGGSGDVAAIKKALGTLQKETVGPKPVLQCDPTHHILLSTLGTINAIVHPPILYFKWKDWDGAPLDSKPPFHYGMSEECAAFMITMCAEVQAIGEALTTRLAAAGSKKVVCVTPIEDWYLETHGKKCTDTSSLFGMLTTHRAYNGLTHPMKEVRGDGGVVKFTPNWASRYLTEDIPLGLVPMKGFAQMMEVPTPCLDAVVIWAQKVMEKEYLDAGSKKLLGADVKSSRCAQAYGFESIDEIIEHFQ